MITLAIDTSFHYLTLVLYRDDVLIASLQKEAFKQQSETILVEIKNLFEQAELEPSQLKQIVLTDGPGSYTGLRIGMTIAKVLGMVGNIDVYTLSSLHVLAGLEEMVHVVLDAKAKRVYYACFSHGKILVPECIKLVDELNGLIASEERLIGDGNLIGRERTYPDYTSHFMKLKKYWVKCEDIHRLVPRYLKENEAYQV